MTICPFSDEILIDSTLRVDGGESNPPSSDTPLAAFSATARRAEAASASPSHPAAGEIVLIGGNGIGSDNADNRQHDHQFDERKAPMRRAVLRVAMRCHGAVPRSFF